MEKFIIITSFILWGDQRDIPTLKALKSNVANVEVDSIKILTEKFFNPLELDVDKNLVEKIDVISVENRPNFDVLFDFGNSLLRNKKARYISVMNGDVCFADADAVRKAMHCLYDAPSRVLCLTRYDLVEDDHKNIHPEITLFLENNTPNFSTADAWVTSTPIENNRSMDYFMGQMNCDSMLAADLFYSGYDLQNPCFDIKIIHMEDEVKDDAFYAHENNKEVAQKFLMEHTGYSINSPYRSTGVIWSKLSWLNAGYKPDAITNFAGSKAIWGFVDLTAEHSVIEALVASLEVIACYYKKDLFIVCEENIADYDLEFLFRVFKNNKKVYFFSIEEGKFILFQESLLKGKHDLSDSTCFLSDLSRLSSSLLANYENIILELRYIRALSDIIFHSKSFDFDFAWFLGLRYDEKIANVVAHQERPLEQRECTLVTSVFKSDEFLPTFISNCKALDKYDDTDHIYLISSLSDIEVKKFMEVFQEQRNAILIWNRKDPGLYECWNIGFRLASTPYVSNANVDDLREPSHIVKLCNILNTHPAIDVAASALYPFYEFSGDLKKHKKSGAPWYSDQQGEFGFHQLGWIEHLDGKIHLKPNNMPHCMPIWRKELHHDFGYFDEKTYGTFADWAFWLKIMLHERKGFMLGEGLSFYYVNLESHNRRGTELELFHRQVECEYLPHFAIERELFDGIRVKDSIEKDLEKSTASTVSEIYERKLKLHGIDLQYGKHRNDFNCLIEALLPLHDDKGKILFLPFIERYFVWGNDIGEAASGNPCPIEQDWIGIVHVPFDAPKWFESSVYPENIFETELWMKSMPNCRGLIALSEDLCRDIQFYYPDLPTLSLKHPTSFEDIHYFDFNAYVTQPTLVQAGDWLRNLQAIHRVNAPGFRKIMLLKDYTKNFLNMEMTAIGDFLDPKVEMLDMVSNEDYDRLLSSSVVICWLYATAANNLVLECIARHTPIIINPLPSIVEYLGEDYPLYIEKLCDAEKLIQDKELIQKASSYLAELACREARESLSYERFCSVLGESSFYKGL